MLGCQASVILPCGTTVSAKARRTNGIASAPVATAAVSSTLRRVTVAIAISSCSRRLFWLNLDWILGQLCRRVLLVVCDLVGGDLHSSEGSGQTTGQTPEGHRLIRRARAIDPDVADRHAARFGDDGADDRSAQPPLTRPHAAADEGLDLVGSGGAEPHRAADLAHRDLLAAAGGAGSAGRPATAGAPPVPGA